jgi:hypothetical protein
VCGYCDYFGEKSKKVCDEEENRRSQKRGLYTLGNPEKHVHIQPHTLKTATIAAHTTAKTAKPARDEMLNSIF